VQGSWQSDRWEGCQGPTYKEQHITGAQLSLSIKLFASMLHDVFMTDCSRHLFTGYCYGVVSYKASHSLRLFSDLLCVPIWNLIIPDSSTWALWRISVKTPSSQAGRNFARNAYEVFQQSTCFIFREVLQHAAKSQQHGTNGFTSPPNEVVLWMFIALKNPSSNAGFEPENVRSNDKHDNR
jgi:hypothetical protein